MEIVSRKRIRSDESTSFNLQNKIFINQKLINLNDEQKMKKIYDKTFNLLFNGAKEFVNKLNNDNKELTQLEIMSQVRIHGDGTLNFLNKEKPIGFPDTKTKSECCNKEAFVNSDCSNCNLILCEFCASSCAAGCGTFLCETCITLFDCGTKDEPICKNCKLFYLN